MSNALITAAEHLPAHLVAEMRSNHAGETGAVWIYKGILAVSQDEEVRSFAEHHLATEQQHLIFFDQWLSGRQKSLFIPLWRLAGFFLGVIAALGGRSWVYASIEAVETFVVSHYESQYAAVERFGDTELLATIQRFCNDEADHRDEAAGDVILPSRWLQAWCRLVSFGSEQAVGVARKL